MCTGAHCLGVSIGDGKSKCDTKSKTVGKYPQGSYAAVVRVIQSEWLFLQRVTNNTGDTFAVVDKMLW